MLQTLKAGLEILKRKVKKKKKKKAQGLSMFGIEFIWYAYALYNSASTFHK